MSSMNIFSLPVDKDMEIRTLTASLQLRNGPHPGRRIAGLIGEKMKSDSMFAVAILENNSVVEIPKKHLSITEAASYAATYNRLDHKRAAVILTHPISKAIFVAKPKSRSA
jgi:hypothetical protein